MAIPTSKQRGKQMSTPDFEFNEVVREIVQVRGNRKVGVFSPAEGSRVAVVYLNASSSFPAIVTKLDELRALCDEYVQRDWVASAKDGCVPGVRVVVTARNNAPPAPEPVEE